jgi:hypothetical protein
MDMIDSAGKRLLHCVVNKTTYATQHVDGNAAYVRSFSLHPSSHEKSTVISRLSLPDGVYLVIVLMDRDILRE